MKFEQIVAIAKLADELKKQIDSVAKLFPYGMIDDETSFTLEQRKAKRKVEVTAERLIKTAKRLGLIRDIKL